MNSNSSKNVVVSTLISTKDVIVRLISPKDENFQILDIFLAIGRIRPNVISSLQPNVISSLNLLQGIDPNKGVIINGRAPIWLYARLVQLCQSAIWIAIYDPKDGAIIVASRSATELQVGNVIPVEKVYPYLPKYSGVPKQKESKDESKPESTSKAIAFLGPPHSGKSVLVNAIRLKLQNELSAEKFQRDFYILRACPDGEGDWFSEIPKNVAKELRYKNRFDDEFVNRICEELEKLRQQKQLLLVDCGGKLDRKNQRILTLCTHTIIVSRDPEQIPLWQGAALLSELKILAEIESVSEIRAEVISTSPLRIRLGKLERGEEQKIAEMIPPELINLLKF